MLITDRRPSLTIDPEELDRIRETYEDGYYLQAYQKAMTWGPLETWEGTAAKLLAGRLALNLGAPGLASRLHVQAWRGDRTDPEACYYRARAILGKKGPLAAWNFLKRIGTMEDADETIRAEWFSIHAIVLGIFRDFDGAWKWMERARDVKSNVAWIHVERAQLLTMEDRYEEALEASEFALTIHPWYRPAVQSIAHLLQLLDRDHEALERLEQASHRLESGPITAQLALLQFESRAYVEARSNYDRYGDLSPLMEEPIRKWLAGRRSDCAYGCGDIPSAIAYARESGEPFFISLADRLESRQDNAKRIVLNVGFVRQHHQTCAPATLAAISRFWGIPADQHEVAEAICYDGTPDHQERNWAEENGFLTREFTVTWDAVTTLIDRGIPFTLTTVEPLNAHLQAVIGYDERRRTLLIRDPTEPYSGEAFADAFLERYRSVGPRGMALLPRARAELLENVELPDASLYDSLYELQTALRNHDRERAAQSYQRLQDEAPEHRLTLQGSRFLAMYDADTTALLSTIEKLLALYPDDVNLRLGQLSCLNELARSDERLETLSKLCADSKSDPLFRRRYAQELLPDARQHATVVRLVRTAMRARPTESTSLSILAEIAWGRQRLDEALELYHFAATLDDKDVEQARYYFNAARYLRRENEVLEMLRQRFQRFGNRSGQPARTLYWALSQLDRETEGFQILEKAIERRPDDGELQLYLAESQCRLGQFDLAKKNLERAKGHSRRTAWLRAAANQESAQGNLADALRLWREILEAEPAALDANRTVTQLLAETESRAAALAHLSQACDRFPHNFALLQAWIYWLRDEGPAQSEMAIRRLLAIHPTDAWAHRELALVLSDQQRHAEALAQIEVARQFEPLHSSEASVRAQVLENAGRQAEANEAFREAIRRSVDNDFAISRLIAACDSPNDRRDALRFIESELARQVIFGDGLIAFARHAKRTLESDELLTALEKAWKARPDLWHAWAALIRHRIERKELEEALELANLAVARFPLLPITWFDLARVHEAREDREQEMEALNRCLQINPGWSAAARQMAQALERGKDYQASRLVLERAANHAPLDAYNQAFLADTLWHLEERETAIERISQATRLAPDYDWAWETLKSWSEELGRPELPVDIAREVTRNRGGEGRSWLRLAQTLRGDAYLEERLAALERVIALEPRHAEAHDLRALLLAQAHRYEEAQAACHPSAWEHEPPLILRGRAAWVESCQGNFEAAIESMREILSKETDYYWGWLKFADWTCDHGTNEDYLHACDHLVRLEPNDSMSWGYRGEAYLKASEQAKAKLDFCHAYKLNPGYAFAGMNLFDLELADKDWDSAGKTLEVLKEHAGGEYVDAREVQWACARHDSKTALEALKRLCVTSLEQGEWPLRSADRALRKAGWLRLLESSYAHILTQSDVHPLVGTLWVECWSARKPWRTPKLFDTLLERGDLGRNVLCAYISSIGYAKSRWKLRQCMRRYGKRLRESAAVWGTVGFALTNVCRYKRAIQWMSDWSEREGVQPWMLGNLVLALRARGQVDVARTVSKHALDLPADNSTPNHTLWLALENILEGNLNAATEALKGIRPDSLDATFRFLFELVTLLVTQAQASSEDRRRVFAATNRDLAALSYRAQIPIEDHKAILDAYRRAIRHMRRDQGGFSGHFWYGAHALLTHPRPTNPRS